MCDLQLEGEIVPVSSIRVLYIRRQDEEIKASIAQLDLPTVSLAELFFIADSGYRVCSYQIFRA